MSTTKVLDVPADWEAWFFIVKSMATGSRTDVWKYVDSDLPTEPAIPNLEDPPNADDYATLSASAKETFKFLYQLWKDRIIQVSKTREVLELIQIYATRPNISF